MSRERRSEEELRKALQQERDETGARLRAFEKEVKAAEDEHEKDLQPIRDAIGRIREGHRGRRREKNQ